MTLRILQDPACALCWQTILWGCMLRKYAIKSLEKKIKLTIRQEPNTAINRTRVRIGHANDKLQVCLFTR